MVSSNEAGLDLRENLPLSRNILHSCGVVDHGNTGQRTSRKSWCRATGYQDWLSCPTSPKVPTGNLNYPAGVRDSAESGMGPRDNRHLNYLVESICVNVGGSQQNVKASSLPMSAESVGGIIVLGAQESCVPGEGCQEFDAPLYSLTDTGCTSFCERERDEETQMPNSGEPGAVKVARRVRRGE